MIPPRSILAAVDFSESSRAALIFAARLAKQCHAVLHVLHAEDPLLHSAARARGMDLTGETREELGTFMLAASPAGDWNPIHHVAVGRSTGVICEVAHQEEVDVVVMGMHGMSGARRAVFGSTTEGVLRASTVSVIAVPDCWTPALAETIDLSGTGPVVVGVDGEEPALDAAAAACRLAKILETSVELVRVVPAMPVIERWRAHADAAIAERMEIARCALTPVVCGLGSEVPVRLRIESGPVAECLTASVKPSQGRNPILVLGRRARPYRGDAPGATAYRVLTSVQVPVLVYLRQGD